MVDPAPPPRRPLLALAIRRQRLGAVLGAFLLICIGSLLVLGVSREREVSHRLLASHVTQTQMRDLLSTVQEAESGQRGYLITGDRESVHRAGVSVRGQTISEAELNDPEDALDYAAWDLNEDRSDWDGFGD